MTNKLNAYNFLRARMRRILFYILLTFIYSDMATAASDLKPLIDSLNVIKQKSAGNVCIILDEVINSIESKAPGDQSYEHGYILLNAMRRTTVSTHEQYPSILTLFEQLKDIEAHENGIAKHEKILHEEEHKVQLQTLHSFGALQDMDKPD